MSGIPSLGPVDFSSATPPDNYRCQTCKAHGVRLWRDYNVMVCYNQLLCWNCAEGKDGSDDNVNGMRRGMCAAVPTKDGETYWGIGSLPANGFVWWRRLLPYVGWDADTAQEREVTALTISVKNLQSLSDYYKDCCDEWMWRAHAMEPLIDAVKRWDNLRESLKDSHEYLDDKTLRYAVKEYKEKRAEVDGIIDHNREIRRKRAWGEIE